MKITDLEIYNYQGGDQSNVKAIGWLEAGSSFAKGACPAGWTSKLAQLIMRDNVNQARGYHSCDFCYKEDIQVTCDGSTTILGSAEIWVPDNSTNEIYAAPNLIYHYMIDHFYLPPRDFIEAVKHFDIRSDWYKS